MKLSLAVASLLAASVGADAAPEAQPGRDGETKIARMVTVSGRCTRLVHAGHAVDGCRNTLVNMNYGTGISSYWFMTERTILSFYGDGSRRIEQGPDTVVQAVEQVVLVETTGNPDDQHQGDDAIGFCRFGNPTVKGSTIECIAHTEAGRYEGTFIADGNPPKFEVFRVGP